jgi:PTH1 family peptidyl-tRNA hydrolase
MKLIIGLGNHGFKYKKTRHNIGFMAIDYIQKNIGGFSKWKQNKKIMTEISKNSDRAIVLAKPQTFMNNSGKAAALLVSSYKFQVLNIFILHDDFDLPIGNFKLEKGKGSAGHKGVQSIVDSLGTNNFWRLRIGIRPKNLGTKSLERGLVPLLAKAEDFVLRKFTKEEKKIIDKTIPKAINALIEATIH